MDGCDGAECMLWCCHAMTCHRFCDVRVIVSGVLMVRCESSLTCVGCALCMCPNSVPMRCVSACGPWGRVWSDADGA